MCKTFQRGISMCKDEKNSTGKYMTSKSPD